MHSTLPYRHEIDGLRAVAVIAVVLYHLDPSWLPGGFLGVDVFFVISGFLITSIIYRDLLNGTFSIQDFWMRRVRRLYPALMAMVLAVTIAGNILLIDSPRRHLVREAVGAVTSTSNLVFWGTNRDYWSAAASESPLLHTWSLSLEDQFYVVFPPLLMLILGRAPRRRFALLSGVAVLSLALCVGITAVSTEAAFYLLPTRLWELLMGGLLAIWPARSPSAANRTWPMLATLIGVALIAVSLVMTPPHAGMPGWRPLIPCTGSVLFLRYGEASGWVRQLFASPPFRFVGRISYSLYLWHWPVIVLSAVVSPHQNLVGVVCLMSALAITSYYFVETPFRYEGVRAMRMLAAASVGLVCSVGAIAASKYSPGLPRALADFNSPASKTRGEEFEATESILESKSGIRRGRSDAVNTVVVVGSSHARVLCGEIAKFVESRNGSVVSLATSAVGVSYVSDDHADEVRALNRRRMEIVRELRPQLAIVAGRWELEAEGPQFRQNLLAELRELGKASHVVLVVCQVPAVGLPDRYQSSLRKYLVAAERAGVAADLRPDAGVSEANLVVESVVKELGSPNVRCVDLRDAMVTTAGTVQVLDRGEFLYSDEHHVNDRGAKLVFERALRPAMERALSEASMTAQGAEKVVR